MSNKKLNSAGEQPGAVRKRTQREVNCELVSGWLEGGWIRVYICAPFDGKDTRSNEKLWWYGKIAVNYGAVPMIPNYYYPHFYYEEDKFFTDQIAKDDMGRCWEMWVFGEEITEQMETELRWAEELGLTIRFFPDWDVIRDNDLIKGV